MPTLSFLTSGKIVQGESEILLRPKITASTKTGVLFVHGVESANGGAAEWMKHPLRAKLLSALAASGHTLVSADLGGNSTWGNSSVTSKIMAARNFLLSKAGVAPGKIAIIGCSMGGLNALNWIAENKDLVSCFVGMLPVVNLTDVHDNNRGGFQPTINAAYGGAYSEAAYGATHNPSTMAVSGKYSGIPMILYYGDSDTTVTPSTVASFSESVGAECVAETIHGGHAESTISCIDIVQLISFIDSF